MLGFGASVAADEDIEAFFCSDEAKAVVILLVRCRPFEHDARSVDNLNLLFALGFGTFSNTTAHAAF